MQGVLAQQEHFEEHPVIARQGVECGNGSSIFRRRLGRQGIEIPYRQGWVLPNFPSPVPSSTPTASEFVVTANYNAKTMSVLLGYGDGTLAAKVDYPTGNHPGSVALGDLNKDGRPDIVFGNDGDDVLSVLFGTGDGKFADAVDYPTRSQASDLALGDLNGDGKLDAVVGSAYINVSVLLGKCE